MRWWARGAGITAIAGSSLLFMGPRNEPKPANAPEKPHTHKHGHGDGHGHNHGHGDEDSAGHDTDRHVTDPFSQSIEYSAITDVLRREGAKVPVPQSSQEWIRLLSQHYQIHAGFVPVSVAAPSSFKEPRLIISVSDPKRANMRNLSGKLFFGFVYHKDGTRDIEFISHNRQTNEFDFGRIEGAELRRPPITKCLECHTFAKPFPLGFPYADTNFNPALSQKLIATLLSDNPAVIQRLGEITEMASKDANPGAKLNEILVVEFGANSKNPLLYGGVPLVSELSLNADLPRFDYETRKVGNAEAIATYLAQIPDRSLRSQLITLSLKHTLACDIERTFPKYGTNKKVRDTAAEFGKSLDRLMCEHTELTPANADEILDLPEGFGLKMRRSTKDRGIFDIPKITNLSGIFAKNAGGKQIQPPQFADASGIAVNMGSADMPFLIEKTAERLAGVTAANKLAMELLVDVLRSDRIDTLASSGKLPTRDEVMTVLAEGIQQEAKRQHGKDIVIDRKDYIDISLPLPQLNVEADIAPLPIKGTKNPVEQNCYSCHGGPKPSKGAIPMDGKGWQELFAKDADKARQLYQESIKRIEDGEMPRGRKLPDADRQRIIDWLRGDPSIPRELLSNPPKNKTR